eukprot:TRINITY_DN11517_c0_g1_i1.p1 TRINITY_DN11517_c0_g1~~TRINITY_DN11517_c0_g1_i1.p1  ORF type:complete len:217 (-),score=47.56 TRINITY_DN11517_c0_g1_i1:106-732(-)
MTSFPIPHLVFKYIIIGPTSVGKSCILLQFTEGYFHTDHEMTIGVEFGTHITTIENQPIKLQIWDTCGQESFRSITRSYYRGAAGVLLVYDVTRRNSFQYLNSWVEEATQNGDTNLTMLLVGNKCDLEEEREVSYAEGKAFADEQGIEFIEVSAKSGTNIEAAFERTTLEIFNKYKSGSIKSMAEQKSISAGPLVPNGKREEDSKCCE